MAARAQASGNANLAIYYFQQALLQEPSRADWRYQAAAGLAKRGNTELAIEELKKVLAAQPDHKQAAALHAELTRPKVVKSQEELEKEEEAAAISSIPFPQPADEKLPPTLAAWTFGPTEYVVEKVNAHNLAASKSQQLNVLFVPGGTFAIEAGKVIVSLDFKQAAAISDGMAQDVRVFPVIKGLSRNWQKVPQAEWARAAAEIAAKAEAESKVAGLVFELTPHTTVLHLLYAEFKKNSRKIVMAMQGDRLTFRYIDVMVAKCFDFGGQRLFATDKGARQEISGTAPDLSVYAGNVHSVAGSTLRNARAMGGKVIFGIPLSATLHEFEAISDGPGTEKFTQTIKIEDYFPSAVKYIERNLQLNDEAFLGMAVWAVQPEGGTHVPPDPYYYYPSEIPPSMWERLKFPLINR